VRVGREGVDMLDPARSRADTVVAFGLVARDRAMNLENSATRATIVTAARIVRPEWRVCEDRQTVRLRPAIDRVDRFEADRLESHHNRLASALT